MSQNKINKSGYGKRKKKKKKNSAEQEVIQMAA